MKKDARIDAYILKSAPFAQPILKHIRELVHKACPEIEETIKWGMPSFDYKGAFCSMAAFKQHCSFGFWKAALMKDSEILKSNQESGMGHLGKIANLKDLPSDKQMIAYIKEAKRLNDEGIKLPPKKKVIAEEIVIHPKFLKALNKNKNAMTAFKNFSPSHRKEYSQWIDEAKSEDTRDRRISNALEWLEEGKSRNWNYEKK